MNATGFSPDDCIMSQGKGANLDTRQVFLISENKRKIALTGNNHATGECSIIDLHQGKECKLPAL